MLKRIISMLLCLVMVFTMLPVQAFAMETEATSVQVQETEPVEETTVPVETVAETAEEATEESSVQETVAADETVPAETAAPEKEKPEMVQNAVPETEPAVTEETEQEPAVMSVYVPGPGYNDEELYEGYLNKLFFGDEGISTFGVLARERLSAADKFVYDVLKPGVVRIANGMV